MGGEVSKPGGNLQNIKTRAQEATQAAAAKGQEFLQNNQNLQNIKTRAQEVAGVAPPTSNTIAAPTLAGDVHEKSIKDLSEAVMVLSKKVGGSKERKYSKKRKHTKKRKYSKKYRKYK